MGLAAKAPAPWEGLVEPWQRTDEGNRLFDEGGPPVQAQIHRGLVFRLEPGQTGLVWVDVPQAQHGLLRALRGRLPNRAWAPMPPHDWHCVTGWSALGLELRGAPLDAVLAHLERGNDELAAASRMTRDRATALLVPLLDRLPGLRDSVEALSSAVQPEDGGDAEWSAFCEKWGYNAEQREAIRSQLATVL